MLLGERPWIPRKRPGAEPRRQPDRQQHQRLRLGVGQPVRLRLHVARMRAVATDEPAPGARRCLHLRRARGRRRPGPAGPLHVADRRPRTVRRRPRALLLHVLDRIGLPRSDQRPGGAVVGPRPLDLGRPGQRRAPGRHRRAPGKDAMPVLAPWVQWAGNWAPSVLVRPNNPPASRYVMYYTARSQDSSPWGGKECVGMATSAVVDGPYVDRAPAPLICVPGAGGTIDPSPFVAADGSLSLQYVDNNGIHAQRLTADGLALAGGEQLLMRADGGYVWEVTRIEGPSMISTPGTGILLFYSVNNFTSPDYAVGVTRCDTPLGPCRRLYSTPTLAKRGAMLGPGGRRRCSSPTARGASRSTPGTTWSATSPAVSAPCTCCRSRSPVATRRWADRDRGMRRRRPARPRQLAHAGRTAIGAFASDRLQRRREPRLSAWGYDLSGRDLADVPQQLLGELPTLWVVDFERLLRGLDQRPSDTANPECWGEVAELSNLGGESFRSHSPRSSTMG